MTTWKPRPSTSTVTWIACGPTHRTAGSGVTPAAMVTSVDHTFPALDQHRLTAGRLSAGVQRAARTRRAAGCRRRPVGRTAGLCVPARHFPVVRRADSPSCGGRPIHAASCTRKTCTFPGGSGEASGPAPSNSPLIAHLMTSLPHAQPPGEARVAPGSPPR